MTVPELRGHPEYVSPTTLERLYLDLSSAIIKSPRTKRKQLNELSAEHSGQKAHEFVCELDVKTVEPLLDKSDTENTIFTWAEASYLEACVDGDEILPARVTFALGSNLLSANREGAVANCVTSYSILYHLPRGEANKERGYQDEVDIEFMDPVTNRRLGVAETAGMEPYERIILFMEDVADKTRSFEPKDVALIEKVTNLIS